MIMTIPSKIATMLVRFLLLSYFGQQTFALSETDKNVICLVVDMDFVQCTWNGQGINHTFHSGFNGQKLIECSTYVLENGNLAGCKQPYEKLKEIRFNGFKTVLEGGNFSQEHTHDLKGRVKLNPPVNLTVTNSSNHELIFYWNHTKIGRCVQNEVRYRNNDNTWQTALLPSPGQNYYHISPSLFANNYYELQVRSRVGDDCHQSIYWSEWSQPVYWESTKKKNNPGSIQHGGMSLWTPVLSVLGALTLITLVILLIHHERLRVIVVPAYVHNFPKDGNVTDWLHIPSEIKKGFDSKFDERDCSVREYSPVPQSVGESESSHSVSMASDQSESKDSSSSSSSSSSVPNLPALSKDQQAAA